MISDECGKLKFDFHIWFTGSQEGIPMMQPFTGGTGTFIGFDKASLNSLTLFSGQKQK